MEQEPSHEAAADPAAHAASGADDTAPAHDLLPWEGDPPPPDPDAPRERIDAFTHAQKAKFLKALMKCGCIQEACRIAGVAPRTVYNHQGRDAEFLSHCSTARRMAAIPLEIAAWSRAVDGIEETVVAGGRAVTRTRHSEHLLRLLLQASDPKRFGPKPGFTRKRMRAAERKEMEREIRREIKPKLYEEWYANLQRIIEDVQAEKRAGTLPGMNQDEPSAATPQPFPGVSAPPAAPDAPGTPDTSGAPAVTPEDPH